MSVSQAVATRISVRAFLPAPVDTGLIADVLARATRAPSGGNLQPWRLFVLAGESMARFRALMETRMSESPGGEAPDYQVYPANLKEPYRSRRFEVGEAMYSLLDIPRSDKFARLTWLQNNDRFFGAPAAAFCFTDRIMDRPQWSDLGMMLQTAMLLFQEAGDRHLPAGSLEPLAENSRPNSSARRTGADAVLRHGDRPSPTRQAAVNQLQCPPRTMPPK